MIVYRDDGVYINGQWAYTPDDYYQKVRTTATAIPQNIPQDAEWMPLGVFAVQRQNASAPYAVLQLAVNNQGVLAGTFTTTATDQAENVTGMVDKETQRASWTVGDNPDTPMIMEAGIYNLTKEQAEVLVHLGPVVAQTQFLIRLDPPKTDTAEAQE